LIVLIDEGLLGRGKLQREARIFYRAEGGKSRGAFLFGLENVIGKGGTKEN